MCEQQSRYTKKSKKKGETTNYNVMAHVSWLMSHGSWLMSHVHVSCGICDISHVMCHISQRPTDESVKIYSKQITQLCPTSGPTRLYNNILFITTALQDNLELYNRALPSSMWAGLDRKRLLIDPQGRLQPPAACKATHCRIQFGRRPAYCAVPKS